RGVRCAPACGGRARRPVVAVRISPRRGSRTRLRGADAVDVRAELSAVGTEARRGARPEWNRRRDAAAGDRRRKSQRDGAVRAKIPRRTRRGVSSLSLHPGQHQGGGHAMAAIHRLGIFRLTGWRGMSRRELLNRGALALCAAALPSIRLRAQTISPVMTTLSGYMAGAKDRALPAEVVEKAKHHILDTFAAMISGSELPPGKAPRARARAESGRPVATVVGSNITTGPIDAALVNGVFAHSDETDDSHGPSQSHPGASIVPSALALGEELGATGEHYLRAVTLGYDIGTRLTMALGGIDFRNDTRRSTHAFAGDFCSAAAAGCVAALSAQQMRWLLDYASQQTGGYAIWERDTDHIEKGFVFAGMPARNGATPALLVRSGWNGVDDVFSGDDNFFQVNAPKGNPAVLIEKLGERYEGVNTDIQKWTVGTPSH